MLMEDEDRVKVEKVRYNGVIIYDVFSILESSAAKKHLKFIRKLHAKINKKNRKRR